MMAVQYGSAHNLMTGDRLARQSSPTNSQPGMIRKVPGSIRLMSMDEGAVCGGSWR